MSTLTRLNEATLAGNRDKVAEITRQALDEGIEINTIIQDGFIPAMSVVGDEFARGIRYIPEMLLAARAMQTGMDVLKPLLINVEVKTLTKVVLGTVKGDMHDIGKNLVRMMLEGSGIEVVDLGVDVSPDRFVEAINTHQPRFVAMSALLTTTMSVMDETIKSLIEAGLKEKVSVLIGGAPINQKFADEIGADGYAANAGEAVTKIKDLLARAEKQ